MSAAGRVPLVFAFLVFALALDNSRLLAQTTVGTGSIVGTIADPSGAVVPGAQVTIMNSATGQAIKLTTNSSGSFNSGALIPGNYKAQIAAQGFRSVEVSTAVLVGNTATVNVGLQIGCRGTRLRNASEHGAAHRARRPQ